MSPTVSEVLRAAAADEGDDEAEASGAWRWITVVVLPVSIAPVPRSTAVTTATISPPTTPASKFRRRFTRRNARGDLLIRRKTRVRWEREQAAQPRDRPSPLRQRTPQGAPVPCGRRPAGAWRGVALLAQQPDVAGGIWARGHAKAALELRQGGAGRIDVAEPRQRLPELLHGALGPAVEVRPAAKRGHHPQHRHRERHEQEHDKP